MVIIFKITISTPPISLHLFPNTLSHPPHLALSTLLPLRLIYQFAPVELLEFAVSGVKVAALQNLSFQELSVPLLELQLIALSYRFLVLESQVILAATLQVSLLQILIQGGFPRRFFNKLPRLTPLALLGLEKPLHRVARHLIDNGLIPALVVLQTYFLILRHLVNILDLPIQLLEPSHFVVEVVYDPIDIYLRIHIRPLIGLFLLFGAVIGRHFWLILIGLGSLISLILGKPTNFLLRETLRLRQRATTPEQIRPSDLGIAALNSICAGIAKLYDIFNLIFPSIDDERASGHSLRKALFLH